MNELEFFLVVDQIDLILKSCDKLRADITGCTVEWQAIDACEPKLVDLGMEKQMVPRITLTFR